MERLGKCLISLFLTSSLFLFCCKEFLINTLIILLIIYILGKSKHLINLNILSSILSRFFDKNSSRELPGNARVIKVFGKTRAEVKLHDDAHYFYFFSAQVWVSLPK